MHSLALLLALASVATAFPGMSPGGLGNGARADAALGRRAAAPYSPRFPYTGAKLDGKAGTGKGGVQVPAPGDTAHAYQDPPPGAHRGPCAGLNAAANHGFLSRDGVTTFDELIAMQQNMYNFDYPLALAFATLAVAFDGDIHTGMMSIGGPAMAQTSGGNRSAPAEPGLDAHNTLESDASLTRNDLYLGGDDHSFNGTLWQRMIDTVATTSSAKNPMFDVTGVAKYRAQRYDESLAENSKFYYGPRAILLYTATALLYRVIPDSATGTVPSVANIAPIFGAVKAAHGPGNATGGWDHVPERLPPYWHNRVAPYSLQNITTDILAQYVAYPKLFGANQGAGRFVPDGSRLNALRSNATAGDVVCQIYESYLDASGVPDTVDVTPDVLQWVAEKLNPLFSSFGCKMYNP